MADLFQQNFFIKNQQVVIFSMRACSRLSAQHSQKKPTPFSTPAYQAANTQNPCGEGIYPRWAAQQPQPHISEITKNEH